MLKPTEDQNGDVTTTSSPQRALPIARLTDDGQHVVITPPAGTAEATARPPFYLPPIAKSLLDGLAMLGERFRARHGRCLAAVLLFDTADAGWACAIPSQRCGRGASCWSAARADFPHLPPGVVVAGSFQTRVLAGGEAPADCPPPHDGLHFVYVVVGGGPPDPGPGTIWSFYRAGDATRHVPASSVVIDDLEATLAQAMPRLTLE